jgi:uncharacterized protein
MPTALITGASKGIGRAIADELASRKFDVLLVARSETPLRELALQLSSTYGVKASYLALDLASPGAAQTLLDWCRTNDTLPTALVNNAGYGLSGPFEKHLVAEHTDMLQVNAVVLMQLCHLFLPELRQQSRGYILNIASSAAYQAIPKLSLYAASKSLVLQFSRGLAQELRGSTVSVTAVSPGATDTDFVSRAQIGEKGLKAAQKVNMTAEAVAKQAVDAMLAGRIEVITGLLNKIGAWAAWLLPKSFIERTAGSIYD